MSAPELLEVDGLTVRFRVRSSGMRPRAWLTAVDDVSLAVETGEVLGLVGESGSGKSTAGRAILRLLPIAEGSVRMDDRDLTALRGRALRRARRDMQMVFQDPYSSLDPSMTIGDSIAEPLRVHGEDRGPSMQRRVVELLDLVGLPGSHARRYPHEFSGGQRQRIAIARAIAVRPRFLVCDEAVSALDMSTQSQVLNLLQDLKTAHTLSYLFISHDLGVVQHMSDRVAVMYFGRIVESGPADLIFDDPLHPYTRALRDSSPIPEPVAQRTRTVPLVEGERPDPTRPPTGCAFASRCPAVMDHCRREVPAVRVGSGGRQLACHLYPDGSRLDVADRRGAT